MKRNALMNRVRGASMAISLAALGCLPKMTIEQARTMQPPHPPELNHLDMFLGQWETTGTMDLAVLDEAIATSGHNKAQWTLDGRMLEDQATLDMGPFGRVTGKTVWTWDVSIGKYRMWWFDSLGETSQAVATFNPRSQIWRLKAKGQKYGRGTSGTGTIHRVDENTLEWTWNEASASGLVCFAKMRGASRRIAPPDHDHPAGVP